MEVESENVNVVSMAEAREVGSVKHHFSKQHFTAAQHFAELAASLQEKEGITAKDKSAHRACVTGAIVFSVAFLEASINELFQDAVDGNQTGLSGLSDHQVAVLAELWKEVEPRKVIEKYQIALVVGGKPKFEKGKEPFQGAESLVKIRNALIHYKPEWDDNQDDHKKLQGRLENRFPLNPWASPNSLWFPHQCLGAGCAEWAVKNASDFMRVFCTRLGIPSRLP